MLLSVDHSRSSRHRLLTVAAVCAGAILLAGLSGQSSGAQSRLDAVRQHQANVRDELASENAAVDAALARVGTIRAREREVTAKLQQKEAELAAAREQLAEVRAALARTKRHVAAARGDLRNLLVFIYRNGEIDETQMVLNAHGFDDLATQADYLGRINDAETAIVNRFDKLRAARVKQVGSMKEAVARIEAARNAIDAHRQALAVSRAAAEQREAELRALRDKRHALLVELVGREKNLVEALSTPAPSAGSQGEAPSTPSAPVAPPSGARAQLNSDGTVTAPADAPETVKAVIAAANQITNTPYIYGGGHGSFDSAGYDCSGSVSFALHGGGLLSSPLDSTGLMTWGEAGPGTWITVYANAGHAYMVVAGLRFDTSGAPPRWQTDPADSAGFAVRHPAGY
jgi:septal ring factor EnvC (AmiA/AmiB activator)